ncbi:MAG: hypothetical protein AAFQ89_08115 [Cyanobacteria bacterium J06626_18]
MISEIHRNDGGISVFWKFLITITEAWIFGMACFLYFRYLPPTTILIPIIFVVSAITSIALPIACTIWDERGFRVPGLFWLILNTSGAYMVASAVLSPQNTMPWLGAIAAGIMTTALISFIGWKLSEDS